ncbi:hypothetical protein ACFYKX_20090 [Cytobacillus sp. FJAT-54145]|uniref:Uncharacterized protein n=1 Tax=Cytobacillus spartinae TaxID=3299023 RepID=A0ABW6KFG6_9BACI
MDIWIQFTDWLEHIGTDFEAPLKLVIFGGLFLLCMNAIVEKTLKGNIKSLILSKHIFNYCVLFLLMGSIIWGFLI